MSLNTLKSGSIGALLLSATLFSFPALSQDDGIRAQLEQSGSTTTDEKREFATDAQQEMDRAVKKLAGSMEDAEKEREAVRLNCLSKKLSSARTLSEVANSAQEAMDAAIAQNDLDKAEHEFRKIAVALQKTREFAAEGEACVGDAGTSPGITSVDVSQGNLDDVDDTEPLDDGSTGLLGIDPPDTSPFQ